MESRVRIETIIGFNGNQPSLLKFLQDPQPTIIYAIGGLVIKENLATKKQICQKVHNSTITALDVSSNGKFVVTGQLMAYYNKVLKSPIILSDLGTLQPVQIFEGMTSHVVALRFSPDSFFLAAVDDQAKLNIRGMKDMKVVSSRVFERKITTFEWGPVDTTKRFPEYQLVSTNNTMVEVHRLNYDVATMIYIAKYSHVTLPYTGLARQYECNVIDAATGYFYAGTRGGEICAFDVTNKIFKASIQVGKSSLRSIYLVPGQGRIYCGFSNGHLKILTGKFDKWVINQEMQLEGEVTSLDMDAQKQNLLIGTTSSNVYILNSQSNQISKVIQGHNSEIVGLDFQSIIGAFDKRGNLKFWAPDNSRSLLMHVPLNPLINFEGATMCFGDAPFVLIGFVSGDIYCINSKTGKEEWSILKSHKNGVTTMLMNKAYIITGGKDGNIRIWGRTHHNLITPLELHTATITKVITDLKDPSIIHCCSMDKDITSYDLRKEKKIIAHRVANGHVLDLVQKKSPEFELITCGINNPVSYWDIDHVKATTEIPIPEKLNCIDISPSGALLAIGSEDNSIFILNTNTKNIVERVTGHSAPITKIKFISENRIVSSSADGSLFLWAL